uniref:Uncharacterized protein n=1 Tax=Heterorhabditis bacteriophora TaxID=37862 RepID=A0A1I7WR05_HETBA
MVKKIILFKNYVLVDVQVWLFYKYKILYLFILVFLLR